MTPRPLIGEDEILAAITGHFEQTPRSKEEVDIELLRAGIDPGEAMRTIKALGKSRQADGMTEAEARGWAAGVLDGLMIGSRAAHEAWERR